MTPKEELDAADFAWKLAVVGVAIVIFSTALLIIVLITL